MAASRTKAKPKEATGTAVANWDEEIARQAKIAAGMEEGAGGAQFFSIKSGVLTFGGQPLPNNEMAVIIADSVLENVFFEGEYDADVAQAPTCFAFGRVEKDMEPHKVVVEAGNQQHDACGGCEMNEWGTANKGRGKACRNVRRLALLPAGTLDGNDFDAILDPEYLKNAAFGFLKVPVTSVRGYANYIKQITNVMKVPPHLVFTKVKVVPDASDMVKVIFSPLKPVPKELWGIMMERHAEAETVIDTPYPPLSDEPKSRAAPSRGKAVKNKRPAVKKGGAQRTAGARRS